MMDSLSIQEYQSNSLPSTGDLFNGFSFRLMLGGSAGECSAELASHTVITPGDGSLLMTDIESLVFLPGFSSRCTTGGGGAMALGTALAVPSLTSGLGRFEYVAVVELSERGLGGSSSWKS